MEYDRFSEIYSIWTATAASTRANLEFYLARYAEADGIVVELGVGDGRVAVEAASRGRHIIGVDSSRAMLALCREHADQAGVLERLSLIEGDFRTFRLPAPASLITLPYHSLGHLTTLAEKRQAIRHIYDQLADGGRFIFDDFQMTPARIDAMRQVQLRACFKRKAGETMLWVTSLVDEATQTMRVVTWEDQLDSIGVLRQRQYRPLSLSWMTATQARELLEEVGFTIEACHGDFHGTPFDPASAEEQVWIARKGRA